MICSSRSWLGLRLVWINPVSASAACNIYWQCVSFTTGADVSSLRSRLGVVYVPLECNTVFKLSLLAIAWNAISRCCLSCCNTSKCRDLLYMLPIAIHVYRVVLYLVLCLLRTRACACASGHPQHHMWIPCYLAFDALVKSERGHALGDSIVGALCSGDVRVADSRSRHTRHRM